MSLKNPKIILLWFGLALLVTDRLTKNLALALPEQGFFYFPEFGFKLYFNQNLAFSLPLQNQIIAVISLLIILALMHLWLKNYAKGLIKNLWPLTLIISGALSNLFDRLKFEGIIDFIDWWFWPAFNLADVYILIGIIWLLVVLRKRGLNTKADLPK